MRKLSYFVTLYYINTLFLIWIILCPNTWSIKKERKIQRKEKKKKIYTTLKRGNLSYCSPLSHYDSYMLYLLEKGCIRWRYEATCKSRSWLPDLVAATRLPQQMPQECGNFWELSPEFLAASAYSFKMLLYALYFT